MENNKDNNFVIAVFCGFVLLLSGLYMLLNPDAILKDSNILEYFIDYLGIAFLMSGISIISIVLFRIYKFYERRFIDVDERYSNGDIRSSSQIGSIDLDDSISFKNYFSNMRSTLLHQIEICDKKSSILLDKGASYAIVGIVFFC